MANHFNADKTNNNLQQQPADSRSAALYDESANGGGAFLSTDDVDHDVDDEGDEMIDEGDVGDDEEVDEEFLQQHDGSLLLQTTNQNHSSSGNTTATNDAAASSQQSGITGILTKQTPQQQQHALAPGLQTQQQRKIVSSQAETAAAAGELANNFGQNVAADTSAAEGGDASSILEQQQAGEEGDDQHQYTDQQELLDYDDDDENADFEQDGEGLADMRSKIREMEQEADKLRHMQTVADKRLGILDDDAHDSCRNFVIMNNNEQNAASKPAGDHATMTVDEKLEIDTRSVYVGNVDYGATAEELEKHFHACGNVVRVTILCDKFSGHPKGFAYIEFGEKEAVDTAVALDESMFRGRQIKVSSKRTNQPGISTSDRGRGRGGLAGRGGRLSRRPFRGGFGGGPTFASRGRGFSHGFAPYRAPRGRRPTRSFHYRGAA